MRIIDEPTQSWDVDPVVNELFWLHYILNAGYSIASFNDEKHLNTHGICYMDFGDLDLTNELAPMLHAQSLYCNKVMKEHFSWYVNAQDFDVEVTYRNDL